MAVVIKSRTQSEDVKALNRVAVNATSTTKNGDAFTLAWGANSGIDKDNEVFVATKATSGLTFKIGRKQPITIATGTMLESELHDGWYLEVTDNTAEVYVAVEAEVNKQIIGATLKGLDPRRFDIAQNVPFSAVKFVKGDIIHVDASFFENGKTPDDVENAVNVELGANGFKAVVAG